MVEFGGMGGGFQGSNFEHSEHNDDSKSSSQLNLANLILVNLVILIKNSANVESKLKYGGCQPGILTPFFTSFRELFDLTSHLIDPEVENKISDWFDKIDVKNAKSLESDVKRGIKLARELKMEMVRLGMLKIFEEPITPPFMVDAVLDDIVKENEKKGDAKIKKSHNASNQVIVPEPIIQNKRVVNNDTRARL
jgi:hypothetical protein